jgi:hypothetical protein
MRGWNECHTSMQIENSDISSDGLRVHREYRFAKQPTVNAPLHDPNADVPVNPAAVVDAQ